MGTFKLPPPDAFSGGLSSQPEQVPAPVQRGSDGAREITHPISPNIPAAQPTAQIGSNTIKQVESPLPQNSPAIDKASQRAPKQLPPLNEAALRRRSSLFQTGRLASDEMKNMPPDEQARLANFHTTASDIKKIGRDAWRKSIIAAGGEIPLTAEEKMQQGDIRITSNDIKRAKRDILHQSVMVAGGTVRGLQPGDKRRLSDISTSLKDFSRGVQTLRRASLASLGALKAPMQLEERLQLDEIRPSRQALRDAKQDMKRAAELTVTGATPQQLEDEGVADIQPTLGDWRRASLSHFDLIAPETPDDLDTDPEESLSRIGEEADYEEEELDASKIEIEIDMPPAGDPSLRRRASLMDAGRLPHKRMPPEELAQLANIHPTEREKAQVQRDIWRKSIIAVGGKIPLTAEEKMRQDDIPITHEDKKRARRGILHQSVILAGGGVHGLKPGEKRRLSEIRPSLVDFSEGQKLLRRASLASFNALDTSKMPLEEKWALAEIRPSEQALKQAKEDIERKVELTIAGVKPEPGEEEELADIQLNKEHLGSYVNRFGTEPRPDVADAATPELAVVPSTDQTPAPSTSKLKEGALKCLKGLGKGLAFFGKGLVGAFLGICFLAASFSMAAFTISAVAMYGLPALLERLCGGDMISGMGKMLAKTTANWFFYSFQLATLPFKPGMTLRDTFEISS